MLISASFFVFAAFFFLCFGDADTNCMLENRRLIFVSNFSISCTRVVNGPTRSGPNSAWTRNYKPEPGSSPKLIWNCKHGRKGPKVTLMQNYNFNLFLNIIIGIQLCKTISSTQSKTKRTKYLCFKKTSLQALVSGPKYDRSFSQS